jgi:hypothetical protein
MLIQKANPTGVDWYISKLQRHMHSKLIAAWGLADADQYHCHGRCYRNRREDGYVAEVYNGQNEYSKDLYWDDNLSVVSFFGIGFQAQTEGLSFRQDIHLVFFGNLSKLALKNGIGEEIDYRGDEEFRRSVVNVIGQYGFFGFRITSVETGIENVLREYPGSLRDQGLKNVDLQPVHCFRVNLTLLYNPNKTC